MHIKPYPKTSNISLKNIKKIIKKKEIVDQNILEKFMFSIILIRKIQTHNDKNNNNESCLNQLNLWHSKMN